MTLFVIRAAAFVFLILSFFACKGGNDEQLPVDFFWDPEASEDCKKAQIHPQ
jgi:hypothetical protein